ncbi:putative damage-inducible protein DinB [Paenibacillus anaericanus]|uniref:DinB family protein n=1 Tax=Paenibacillus TaxID=44249 RepID=UPI00278967DD|nr:DinB family protein [Paenibacillus anaericanus]MDQ0092001.1 putative damage-inducible protein DinB [Paenibacillus anaericanus]
MQTIQKMFEHLHWANQRMLETLQNVETQYQQVRLFSHILNAEQVWATRLRGMDSSQLPIWSDSDMAYCAQLSKQNEESFAAVFAELTPSDLDNLITYTNSKGEEITLYIRDILIHVALHGQYHRGQINSRLRADGIEPVVTDYHIFAN